jgi:hypothetical protein
MEEVMPKVPVIKKFVVDYKAVNILLKKKKKELEKIQKKVGLPAKLDIELQIKAIDLIISKCVGKMSKTYEGV